MHLYAQGGHSFGIRQQGTTSDLWAEQLEALTDGNLVTGRAWTAHAEWLRQFLAVLGGVREEAVTAKA